jgi:2-polyprenyl-3-methyl-5-hydroxy-6-metoxy-1,4-benzoquinol methylase
MWEQMDSLDMGCGGGSGGNTSSMFARAGLAVSTPLNDSTLGRQINTGRRHYDTCDLPNDYSGRTKRQVETSINASTISLPLSLPLSLSAVVNKNQ